MTSSTDRCLSVSSAGPWEGIIKQSPNLDVPATAAALLGSLLDFRLIESLAESDANGISQERFVSVWAGIYRAEPPKRTSSRRHPSMTLVALPRVA